MATNTNARPNFRPKSTHSFGIILEHVDLSTHDAQSIYQKNFDVISKAMQVATLGMIDFGFDKEVEISEKALSDMLEECEKSLDEQLKIIDAVLQKDNSKETIKTQYSNKLSYTAKTLTPYDERFLGILKTYDNYIMKIFIAWRVNAMTSIHYGNEKRRARNAIIKVCSRVRQLAAPMSAKMGQKVRGKDNRKPALKLVPGTRAPEEGVQAVVSEEQKTAAVASPSIEHGQDATQVPTVDPKQAVQKKTQTKKKPPQKVVARAGKRRASAMA